MPNGTPRTPAEKRLSPPMRWLRAAAHSIRGACAAMGRRRHLRVDLDTMPDWLRRDLGFDDPQRRRLILGEVDGPEGDAAETGGQRKSLPGLSWAGRRTRHQQDAGAEERTARSVESHDTPPVVC